MSKPATMNTADPMIDSSKPRVEQAVWLLKAGTAMKLGKQAAGGVDYQILADGERTVLMIRIIGNGGGGYFSKEVLPFSNIEACIEQQKQGQPFPSKLLQTAFTGRSSNNAGFLAAILRAEGLLALAPDTEGRHIISGNWAEWGTSLLSESGQPITTEAEPPNATMSENNTQQDQTKDKKTPAVSNRKK